MKNELEYTDEEISKIIEEQMKSGITAWTNNGYGRGLMLLTLSKLDFYKRFFEERDFENKEKTYLAMPSQSNFNAVELKRKGLYVLYKNDRISRVLPNGTVFGGCIIDDFPVPTNFCAVVRIENGEIMTPNGEDFDYLDEKAFYVDYPINWDGVDEFYELTGISGDDYDFIDFDNRNTAIEAFKNMYNSIKTEEEKK